jgi:hypothetical protein
MVHQPDERPDESPLATGDPAGDAQTGLPRKRRFDVGLLVASLVIALGAALIVWGFQHAFTGTDSSRPSAIETLSPPENAIQVLSQDGIIVDLQYGYEAELRIDGIDIPVTRLNAVETKPGQQVDLPPTAVFDPANAVLSFQPVKGAVIESLSEGLHTARVLYWKTAEGRDSARTYTWSFNVI